MLVRSFAHLTSINTRSPPLALLGGRCVQIAGSSSSGVRSRKSARTKPNQMPGLEDAYSNMTAACIPSTSVHGSDKAIGVPLLRAALAGAETPVASFRPCFLSSVLIFVMTASPVPSVETSLSAPAESAARICVQNARVPQRPGKDVVHATDLERL